MDDPAVIAQVHRLLGYHVDCGMCPRCHPGKQWGGPEKCRVVDCRCHTWRKP